MRLEDIGFYTLSDSRAASTSESSRLWRCEILLTGRCNFRCPYCRRVGGADAEARDVLDALDLWAADRLFAVRFSGGEPTMHPRLDAFVSHARGLGIERIALSTNGSAPWPRYERLLAAGVDDFSVSLDACCAADGDMMAGGISGAWQRIVDNIRRLSERTYVTAGVVLTEANVATVNRIIEFAATLGVSDIRVIPAAQAGATLAARPVSADILARFPILRYRMGNLRDGRPVRGLTASDARRCALVLDDMAVVGREHYPCIIYLREGGAPIGKVGPQMRAERTAWFAAHDCHADSICAKNCLDVCVAYNNRALESRDVVA